MTNAEIQEKILAFFRSTGLKASPKMIASGIEMPEEAVDPILTHMFYMGKLGKTHTGRFFMKDPAGPTMFDEAMEHAEKMNQPVKKNWTIE